MSKKKQDHSDLVKDHFEMKYHNYDVLIRKLIPRYEEMHASVLEQIHISAGSSPKILDLGIGTGETACKILQKYPQATIDGIDISRNMLKQARARLKNYSNSIRFLEQDMKDLEPIGLFDACVGVLSIHHLDAEQKQKLFRKVFEILKKDGVFVIGDIVKFDTNEETEKEEENWKAYLRQQFEEKEAQYWFENYQEEDLPSSALQQVEWLKNTGFSEARIEWCFMNYAVLAAKK